MQWSQSSVIFTAHATQALITGRHFSSSKQFVLPSPPPIIASPGSYDPPSVLSVSPGDLWLFAFFPRRDGEGVGCLWKRGAQIDNWPVNECWTYPKGGGAVTASWLGSHREVRLSQHHLKLHIFTTSSGLPMDKGTRRAFPRVDRPLPFPIQTFWW